MEPTPEILQSRAKWVHTGNVRPAWADAPGHGQRSVWDFPRPPRVERVEPVVRVALGGRVIAESAYALQVLETASPPTVYLPRADVHIAALVESATTTICEWKGLARHFGLSAAGRHVADAAWAYDDPFPEFAEIAGYVSFHPARVGRCWVGDEIVGPQPGAYYGGWVTSDLAGPFKGVPGSLDW